MTPLPIFSHDALDRITLPAALVPVTEPTPPDVVCRCYEGHSDDCGEPEPDPDFAPRTRVSGFILSDDTPPFVRVIRASRFVIAARRYGECGAECDGELAIIAYGNDEADAWLAAVLYLVCA